MTKPNKKRNQTIAELFKAGRSSTEILAFLEAQGYPQISRNRIWHIYKASPDYSPTKQKIMFCHFCQENKVSSTLYHLKKMGAHKITARMCQDCFDQQIKPEPINYDK